MKPQSFFCLQFARIQLAEQCRNALEVGRELCFHLRHRPLHLLVAHRLNRWGNLLRHPGRERFGPPPHFDRLCVQHVFEAPVQLVQAVVLRGFKLRRVFSYSARRSLHLLQRSARRRHLLLEARANFRQRLPRFRGCFVHRVNQIGKSLAHFVLFALLHFLRSLRQLLDQPLQAAVER